MSNDFCLQWFIRAVQISWAPKYSFPWTLQARVQEVEGLNQQAAVRVRWDILELKQTATFGGCV